MLFYITALTKNQGQFLLPKDTTEANGHENLIWIKCRVVQKDLKSHCLILSIVPHKLQHYLNERIVCSYLDCSISFFITSPTNSSMDNFHSFFLTSFFNNLTSSDSKRTQSNSKGLALQDLDELDCGISKDT